MLTTPLNGSEWMMLMLVLLASGFARLPEHARIIVEVEKARSRSAGKRHNRIRKGD